MSLAITWISIGISISISICISICVSIGISSSISVSVSVGIGISVSVSVGISISISIWLRTWLWVCSDSHEDSSPTKQGKQKDKLGLHFDLAQARVFTEKERMIFKQFLT